MNNGASRGFFEHRSALQRHCGKGREGHMLARTLFGHLFVGAGIFFFWRATSGKSACYHFYFILRLVLPSRAHSPEYKRQLYLFIFAENN